MPTFGKLNQISEQVNEISLLISLMENLDVDGVLSFRVFPAKELEKKEK